MNLQLVDTSAEIVIRKNELLFQVQPVPIQAYQPVNGTAEFVDVFAHEGGSGMSDAEWSEYRKTFRAKTADEAQQVGDYAMDVLKLEKS